MVLAPSDISYFVYLFDFIFDFLGAREWGGRNTFNQRNIPNTLSPSSPKRKVQALNVRTRSPPHDLTPTTQYQPTIPGGSPHEGTLSRLRNWIPIPFWRVGTRETHRARGDQQCCRRRCVEGWQEVEFLGWGTECQREGCGEFEGY